MFVNAMHHNGAMINCDNAKILSLVYNDMPYFTQGDRNMPTIDMIVYNTLLLLSPYLERQDSNISH